jgi:glycosyltransferase involved in cell wall biosynthesis
VGKLMDRIAVFISHYSIANSPSIVNLLDFLNGRYKVDVYLRRVALTDCPVLRRKNIRTIKIKNAICLLKLRCLFRRYKELIAIDPHGFLLCKDLFPHSRPIYYSLELYLSYDHFGLHYPEEVRHAERSQIGDIKALIIQSQEKEKLFRLDYSLTAEIPALILPVTYSGPSDRSKSTFLKKKYGFKENTKIALHLGGIAEWFSCLEMTREFAKLKDWILFFQGYGHPPYVAVIKEYIRSHDIKNVIISEETYEDITIVDDIIKSCHIGIAWYNDISTGFRVAGWSSGKISAYMRFGLPVIAKAYQSTNEVIQDNNAGICINHIHEIKRAVDSIEIKYQYYSVNSATTYDKYFNFNSYINRLENLMAD